jgi:hypothetical protein
MKLLKNGIFSLVLSFVLIGAVGKAHADDIFKGDLARETDQGVPINVYGSDLDVPNGNGTYSDHPIKHLSDEEFRCAENVKKEIFQRAKWDKKLQESLQSPGFRIDIEVNSVSLSHDPINKADVDLFAMDSDPGVLVLDKHHLYVRVLDSGWSSDSEGSCTEPHKVYSYLPHPQPKKLTFPIPAEKSDEAAYKQAEQAGEIFRREMSAHENSRAKVAQAVRKEGDAETSQAPAQTPAGQSQAGAILERQNPSN